ncbi:hypothetical protein CVT26_014183 [Gymnopilus dilepis]|uniref:Uncharacterized protein n=1 Tax=Gymnopilus dilepis TaxID=231916 RepID=A0A409VU89_9AGAR|nr:hypothetical protein CVT26_014183 [Gymnopilus dilepis]
MVHDIGGAVNQLSSLLVAKFCLLLRDFRIFDDAKFAASADYNADGLGGIVFGYYLRGTVGLFLNAVSKEHGIGNANKAVVNTVSMNVEDFAFGEVRQDSVGLALGQGCTSSSIEPAVAIWSDGHPGRRFQNYFAVIGEAW